MTALTPEMTQTEGDTGKHSTKAYGVAWRKQRVSAGLCVMCSGPSRQKPDGSYKYLCQVCADKAVVRQRTNYATLKKQRHEWPTALTPARPKETWCLRCDGLFPSPDVVKVRICPTCRPDHEAMIERGLDAEGWAIDEEGRG